MDTERSLACLQVSNPWKMVTRLDPANLVGRAIPIGVKQKGISSSPIETNGQHYLAASAWCSTWCGKISASSDVLEGTGSTLSGETVPPKSTGLTGRVTG